MLSAGALYDDDRMSDPYLLCRLTLMIVLLAGGVASCGDAPRAGTPKPAGSGASESPVPGPTPRKVDVCAAVTYADAEAIIGKLPMQPTGGTNDNGFDTYRCLYIGPRISGEGGNMVVARLTVSAGFGKYAESGFQYDVDRLHATVVLPGVGDTATRNEAGTFVWAKRGGLTCTAEAKPFPADGTGPDLAKRLGELCQKVFSKN